VANVKESNLATTISRNLLFTVTMTTSCVHLLTKSAQWRLSLTIWSAEIMATPPAKSSMFTRCLFTSLIYDYSAVKVVSGLLLILTSAKFNVFWREHKYLSPAANIHCHIWHPVTSHCLWNILYIIYNTTKSLTNTSACISYSWEKVYITRELSLHITLAVDWHH